MKRFIKIICIVVLCILLSAIIVSAHSGRTDSNGGHYNRSTGEYHYHHGYSAHEHYDMDGDGIKDCPYTYDTYDKKTNYNNSEVVNNKTNNETSLSWVYWLIGIMAVVVCVMFFVIRAKNKEIEEHKIEIANSAKKLRNLEESMKNQEQIYIATHKKEINNLTVQITSLEKQLNERNSELIQIQRKVQNMEKAPNGMAFAEDGMPIFWKKNADRPYGDYTVFYSSKSKIYHIDRYCAAVSSTKQHIFNVIGTGTPCKKCAEGFFDFTSVPEWFTNKTNKKE
ncbi:MAG: YHYH domain-containing protein [Clostridia bacterium]|nr:YHYH domain-containing protein [Clostridia bacterium]